jgi:hypothetical protein
MSCLKLHWPQSFSVYPRVDAEWRSDSDGGDHHEGDSSDGDDGPIILSFPRRTGTIAGRIGPNPQRDLLARARIIHENRCCEECGRASVVPVDAEPALAYRDSMPIPGSGTLLGFACECCGHEWRV